MKLIKLNSLTTLLFGFLIISLVFLLPTALLELLWNNTLGKTYADINIDFWQALILWLCILVLINILGIFKFEFAIETDKFDKELLKKKLEDLKNLQNKIEEKPETNTEVKTENKD